MRAFLILEDGTVYEGRSIGRQKEIISEIVFNTSMTGYEEVLTDPSYTGQAVVMTYPLIGNYGVCEADMQSGKPHADAFIVRDISRLASSWRAENTLQNFLTRNSIGGIAGIDTRDLTRRLRDHGTMNGCITTALYEGEALSELIRKMKAYRVSGAVERASVREIRRYVGARGAAEDNPVRKRVALLDAGTKAGIVQSLTARGFDVTVYPSFSSAEEILADQPDGIMISNGPGDPADNTDMIREIRKLALRASDFCNLSRPSAHGARNGRQHLQAEIRAQGSEPSGEGSPDGQGLYHVPEPRVCRGRVVHSGGYGRSGLQEPE